MNNTTRKTLAGIKSKIEELAAQADELKNELEALRDEEKFDTNVPDNLSTKAGLRHY